MPQPQRWKILRVLHPHRKTKSFGTTENLVYLFVVTTDLSVKASDKSFRKTVFGRLEQIKFSVGKTEFVFRCKKITSATYDVELQMMMFFSYR
jgi:hypothetical protein